MSEPFGESGFMTVADAVRNAGVQAKKTILRWAQADGIREVYGRTASGGNTIERVVPVDWIVARMQQRGIPIQPEFERVMILEHATFNGGQQSNLPVAPGSLLTPEAVEAIGKLHDAFQQSMRQVEVLMEDRARQNDEIKRVVREGQEEEHRLHAVLKRTNTIGFVALAVGVLALAIGVVFSVRLGVSLHRNQAQQSEALGLQFRQTREALGGQLAALKAENERLRAEEQVRSAELSDLRDALQAMQIGLERRDDRITEVLSARIRRAEDLGNELERIKQEKAQIAEQIKDILATEAARVGK